MFVITNNVEGLVNGVYLRKTFAQAVKWAVDLAAEQCDMPKKKIKAELQDRCSFTSPNGDIIVGIDEAHLPVEKPVKHRLTVRLPVEVCFTTDPAELESQEKEGERKPGKKTLVDYLKDALRLDVDTEAQGQPAGAVFAAAGIDWAQAEVLEG